MSVSSMSHVVGEYRAELRGVETDMEVYLFGGHWLVELMYISI